eukprot:scaffold1.g5383.t1
MAAVSPEQLALSNWAVLAALAAPHLLYAYIWFYSKQWHAAFKSYACEVFEWVAWALKGVQFSAVVWWYLLRSPGGVDPLAIPPFAAGLGVLNVGIFNAIGHAGVYYGFKLGHTIPWYVGSVLSVWGLAVLVWSQAPAGLGWLAAYWTALYVITGIQESS